MRIEDFVYIFNGLFEEEKSVRVFTLYAKFTFISHEKVVLKKNFFFSSWDFFDLCNFNIIYANYIELSTFVLLLYFFRTWKCIMCLFIVFFFFYSFSDIYTLRIVLEDYIFSYFLLFTLYLRLGFVVPSGIKEF